MSFADLGLSSELVAAVKALGYSRPTPIQESSIPLILSGRDVVATAQTGTGKTAAFALPILQRLGSGQTASSGQVRALVLTPTRELALQVEGSFRRYGQRLSLRTAAMHGGVKADSQLKVLAGGIDLLVATPGRLLDLYQRGAIDFTAFQVLVLDEADRMLDLGFIPDIKRIVQHLPKRRQTLMFSATFSQDIRQLASRFLDDPAMVQVAAPNAATELVQHTVYPVDQGAKADLLVHLINVGEWSRVLVFTRTREGADRLCRKLLHAGIDATPIHSDKEHRERQRALADFKAAKIQVLVATDVAARGLDIELLPEVVNFDLPAVAEDYVHRIGRAGRAGSVGRAHSLVCAQEAQFLVAIQGLLGESIPKKCIEGFGAARALAALDAKAKTSRRTDAQRLTNPRRQEQHGKPSPDVLNASSNKENTVVRKRKPRRLRPAGAVGGLGKNPSR